MQRSLELNSIVVMKKPHACGNNQWQVIRTGADVKLRCLGCGHAVMMDYETFTKKLKKVITNE